MQTYLNIQQNRAGNLIIKITPEGKEYLEEEIQVINSSRNPAILWKQDNVSMWYDLLESYACNGSYNMVPNGYFALTDAPIIADQPIEYSDNGNKQSYPPETRFWYFNDYMLVNVFHLLCVGTTIIFHAVEKEINIPAIQAETTRNLSIMWSANDYTKYNKKELETEWVRRQVITERKKAKEITIIQQLQFIINNNPEHEKHDIEKIYKSIFCKALSNAIPYTHFSNDCNYLLTSYKVNYQNTIKAEVNRFEGYIKSLGITIGDFGLYYYCHNLFESYYLKLKEDTDKVMQFSVGEKSLMETCQLIMYLVDKNFNENYEQCNKFLDVQNVAYSQAAYNYKYGNIEVKKFANGRLDLKGLTKDQKEIINKLFKLHEILRNK